MRLILIPIGFVLGSISFYLTRWVVNRYHQKDLDFEKPFWEDPERMCEWPECNRRAEFSYCYCNKHMKVDAAGFPIYHEGKILPGKPAKIKIIKDDM
jgi:hypothetical protein